MADVTLQRTHTSDERGFSLIETMIAMAILATGLLSLAGVFIMGLGHLAGSSAALIAREKAREAVESVHTARDTRVITWCQIYNVDSTRGAACAGKPAACFSSGQQPLRKAGTDGLVNTADDDAQSGWRSRSVPGLTTSSATTTTCGRCSPVSLARSRSARS